MCGCVHYGNMAHRKRVQGLDVLEVCGWKRVWSWQCFSGFHVYQLHFRINIQCWRQHGRVPFILTYDLQCRGRLHCRQHDNGQLVLYLCKWVLQRACGCETVCRVANYSLSGRERLCGRFVIWGRYLHGVRYRHVLCDE